MSAVRGEFAVVAEFTGGDMGVAAGAVSVVRRGDSGAVFVGGGFGGGDLFLGLVGLADVERDLGDHFWGDFGGGGFY